MSPRERRFLLVAGAALVAFLATNYVVAPAISSQMQVRKEYREKLKALERYQLVVEGKKRYEKKYADAEKAFAQLQQLLQPGEKLSLAGANVQAILHKAAGEAGVTIVSENILPPKKAEGFTQVTVDLFLNADVRKLRDFLYKIETSEKLLTVPKLLFNAAYPRPGAELGVQIQISGYTQATEEKP